MTKREKEHVKQNICTDMPQHAKPGLVLTYDPLSFLASVAVGHIGLVTNLFQFDLVVHSGSRQDKVLMEEPDPVVTLQTALGCRDTAQQGHQHQQHLLSAPTVGSCYFAVSSETQLLLSLLLMTTIYCYCNHYYHIYSCFYGYLYYCCYHCYHKCCNVTLNTISRQLCTDRPGNWNQGKRVSFGTL